MIDTVAVLDRICFIAEKAGLFTFDLRKLLDDYLGDVQIVTEFGSNRTEILDAFDEVLTEAHKAYPRAAIYLVAHSEGTVVSFLGLLNAFRAEELPAWANSVRGLMTIGSPIDKHLVLWPELFGEGAPRHSTDHPIDWRNYYDEGDPVGFALDDARAWIQLHEWRSVFDFPPQNDYGFTRYPFPGKAHVDYWTDDAVFGHFISNVVKETRGPAPADPAPAPADDRVSKFLSFVVPYVAIAAVLLTGVYILFKAVMQAIAPNDPAASSTGAILVNVLRNTFVVLGVTVAARVPRLTKSTGLRAGAVGFAVLTCAIYWITAWLMPSMTSTFAKPDFLAELSLPDGLTTVLLATIVIGLSYAFGAFLPSWGVTPLLMAGGLVVVGKIVAHVWTAKTNEDVGALWPVFLATAAFLYLWWLAALILDLTVTWHWYIRGGRVLHQMDEIMGGVRGAAAASDGGHTLAPQVQR